MQPLPYFSKHFKAMNLVFEVLDTLRAPLIDDGYRRVLSFMAIVR